MGRQHYALAVKTQLDSALALRSGGEGEPADTNDDTISLEAARGQWDNCLGQLAIALKAFCGKVGNGEFESARGHLKATLAAVQNTIAAGYAVADGIAVQERELKRRAASLECDPVISAILTLDPNLHSLERFSPPLRGKLRELRDIREQLRERGGTTVWGGGGGGRIGHL